MSINHVHVEPSPCSACGQVLECASDPFGRGRSPGPGDITLCMHCGIFNVYGTDMRLRAATPEELRTLMANPRARRAQAAVMRAIQVRNGGVDLGRYFS